MDAERNILFAPLLRHTKGVRMKDALPFEEDGQVEIQLFWGGLGTSKGHQAV